MLLYKFIEEARGPLKSCEHFHATMQHVKISSQNSKYCAVSELFKEEKIKLYLRGEYQSWMDPKDV